MHDVLVIGAGLSGLITAYKTARSGLQTKVVAKGLGGALHWSAGTIDLIGYVQDELVKSPRMELDRLITHRPGHPYARLEEKQLFNLIDEFVALTHEIGLPYMGAAASGENILLPSPVGAVRPTFLAPKGQIAGDLRRAEPMVVVGFKGQRDFYPKLIVENLQKQGYSARALVLPADLITHRRESNTVHLANGLEDQKRLSRLGKALKPELQGGERVGFPAVLGMEGHEAVLTALEKQLNAPVFEIPTLPPSVPGIRLFKALRKKLQEMGVRVEVGMEVIAANHEPAKNGEPGVVQWIETESSSRPLRHRARHYVLATGGILGGGFDSNINGRVWETIFDLPITAPQQRNKWFQASFLDPKGHPVFSGGVAVNDQLQPISAAGTPLYENLSAVGNMLADSDAILERSLEGVAIVTGLAAGAALTQTQ